MKARRVYRPGDPVTEAAKMRERMARLSQHAGTAAPRQRDPGDVDRAAEVIACCLYGNPGVAGEWWNARPIRNGIAKYCSAGEPAIAEALLRLGVERKKAGKGERWRLERWTP
jgi:hypothetical protein